MSSVHSRNGFNESEILGADGLDPVSDRDPLEELATEFTERLRRGERVSAEQYAARNPQIASEIRELFSTIVVMEELRTKKVIESAQTSSMPSQLGDYRIVSEIARGGMGIVYEAEQVSLGRRVAVKVLPTHALRRKRDIRRFEREAQTAASLHHSNIVPVFGVGEENGQRYIVMQLIRGVGLDEILHEIREVMLDGSSSSDVSDPTSRLSTVKRSAARMLDSALKLNSTSVVANAETVESVTSALPGPVAPIPLVIRGSLGAEYYRNVARIGLQAAEAIQYAHRHDTLHRDIKPGNLILDQDGRVWVADFGLAKAVQDDEVTCSGDVVGTIAYVAPERFKGTTTKLSDIYSLGITLHELLTMQKAFRGEDRMEVMDQLANSGLTPPRKLNKAVPPDLETIVLKAAAKEPRDRYQSASALANDLEAFLEDRPIKARPLSPLEKSVRWCHRNRAVASLLVLLAAAVGLLALANRNLKHQRQNEEQISALAIGALDEIYTRFATPTLRATLSDDEDDGNQADPPLTTPMPISADVASLLENLLEFYDGLSRRAGDSELVKVKLISASRRVGDIHLRLEQYDDARDSYEDAISRLETLTPPFLHTTEMRLEAAHVHNGIGLAQRNSGDRAKAHRNAVAILDYPESTDEEQFELATSLYLLHRAERLRSWSRRSSRDKRDEAQEPRHVDRAEQILVTLKKRNADQSDYDMLMARCLLAKQKGFGWRRMELQEEQSKAISILTNLVEQHPDNPEYQFELGRVYQQIERPWAWSADDHPRNSEQRESAEERLRHGLEATADLENLHPNIPKYYGLKKELHEFLGKVLRAQERYSEAESEYLRAIEMQRMLIRKSQHPERHRPYLQILMLDFGKLLRDANELDRANTWLNDMATTLKDQLANASATEIGRHRSRHGRLDNRKILESVYVTLADVLIRLGDTEASRAVMEKVTELSW